MRKGLKAAVSAAAAASICLQPVFAYAGKTIKDAYHYYPTRIYRAYSDAFGWDFETGYTWEDDEGVVHGRHSVGYQYDGYEDILDLLISQLEEEGVTVDLSDGTESGIAGGYYPAYGTAIGTNVYVNGRANKIVKAALAEIGTSEDPLYSNSVKYNTDLGYGSIPWSATFISWLVKECGLEETFGNRTADCQTLLNSVSGTKYLPTQIKQWGGSDYSIVSGDLVFWYDDNRLEYTHVGIVTHADKSSVSVTQGNTSSCKVLEITADPSTSPSLASGVIVHVDYPGFSFDGDSNIENIVGFLHEEMGLNKAAIVGILANLSAESGILPFRCENDFGDGYTASIAYTEAVDSGSVTREEFLGNGPCGGPGYGLCQWSFNRKAFIYDQAKAMGLSVGDVTVQMIVLAYEIGYSVSEVSYAETAHTDGKSVENNLYAKLAGVPDTEEGAIQACYYWCNDFERCVNAEEQGRNRYYARGSELWNTITVPD